MNDFTARIYNGLNPRVGYPVIVLTKPIVPVTPKRPWWKFW
jgi:hypothetical protein